MLHNSTAPDTSDPQNQSVKTRLPRPLMHTAFGRYDIELGQNAPGWTVAEAIAAEASGPVISLGPNFGLNEAVLAAKLPERAFILVDRHKECLDACQAGYWSMDQLCLSHLSVEQLNSYIAQTGGAEFLIARQDGVYRKVPGANIHCIHAEFPTPLSIQAQVCLAFNCLPCGITASTAPLFRWLLKEVIHPGGILVNEWGVFRLLKSGDSLIDVTGYTPRPTALLNTFLEECQAVEN